MAEVIVVHGSPGSGKSSQSRHVVAVGIECYDVSHVSAGNRLRGIRTGAIASRFSHIVNDSDVPRPLPDDIVNGVMFEAIDSIDTDRSQLVLLDGFPRKPHTVPLFIQTLHERHDELRGVIHLELSQELSLQRLLARGIRHGEKIDDEASYSDFAKKRFEEDEHTTHRAVALLGEFVTVHTVDASGSKRAVAKEFVGAVRRLLASPDEGLAE